MEGVIAYFGEKAFDVVPEMLRYKSVMICDISSVLNRYVTLISGALEDLKILSSFYVLG